MHRPVAAAGRHRRTVPGVTTTWRGPVKSRAPLPVLPPHAHEAGGAELWPLRDFLELGALPSAVPCARLHARLVVHEWGFTAVADNVELVVSELVTNAMHASRGLGVATSVLLLLLSDAEQMQITVWDPSPCMPIHTDVSVEAESGRGLVLVGAASPQLGRQRQPRGRQDGLGAPHDAVSRPPAVLAGTDSPDAAVVCSGERASAPSVAQRSPTIPGGAGEPGRD